MYCGWRPIQRVFRLKRRKRALIGREQTTGSAGGSDCLQLRLYDNKNESEEKNMDFDYEESVYLAADLLERMEEMKREAEAEAEETNDEEEQA